MTVPKLVRRLHRPASAGLLVLGALALLAAPPGRAAPPTARAVPDGRAAALKTLAPEGATAVQRERLAGVKAPARLDVLVVMCDFADSLMFGRHGEVPGDFPPPAQTELLYPAHDAVYFSHLLDDVRRYFDAVSGGAFDLRTTIHPETVNLPETMGWYGNHPELGEQKVVLARDVVAAVDPAVDFSLYDTLMLIHAGAGEETDILGDSPEQIYSSYLGPEDFLEAREEEILTDPWLATDDLDLLGQPVVLDQVLVLPETEYQDPAGGVGGYFGSLGVYCFEVGLRLGMLSLSDFTPGGAPDSQGIGQFGLMGYGLFTAGGLVPAEPCAFNRMLMGWVTPYEVDPDADGTYSLFPIEAPAADSTLARVEIGPSEYWLLEYRRQDPDGNGIFSWADDVNGNGIPDFYRQDDPSYSPWVWTGEGWIIDSVFDPAVHADESYAGAEWDFYMSDNSARAEGVKGAGSGLYIWHIDEGVVRAGLLSPTNIYNADPRRKAVDVEEADGIQDLDIRRGTPWLLGGDDDSFRAEGAARFGPDTDPDTRTAGGVPTGIVIDEISPVVVDSFHVVSTDPEAPTVIRYRERMTFRCRREGGAPDGATPTATLDLPGVDLAGAHLLAADLDSPPDGTLEIVAADRAGRVFAWRHDLTPLVAGGDAPGHLATGTDSLGTHVTWNGPPAAGDVDGDGDNEIVLTAPNGIYVFEGDGAELRDGDGQALSFGLAARTADPEAVTEGPALLMSATSAGVITDAGSIIVTLEFVAGEADSVGTFLYRNHDAAAAVDVEIAGGGLSWTGLAGRTPPLLLGGLRELVYDPEDDETGIPSFKESVFGFLSGVSGRPSGAAPLATPEGILIPLTGGGCFLAERYGRETVWETDRPVRSTIAPGGGYLSDGVFVRAGLTGAPLTGWPLLPANAVRADDPARNPSALSWALDGETFTLFTARDGRLFLADGDGDLQAGWPLAGPGEAAGTPVAADLDGLPGLEIVAAGTMARLTAPDTEGDEHETAAVSRLVAWSVPGTGTAAPVWPMWGGAPARAFQAPAATGGTPGGDVFLDGSLVVTPNPVRDGRLTVRAVLTADGELSAALYNLEGELVARSARAVGFAGQPVQAVLDVAGAASGPYLCRVEARTDAGERSEVIPAAIER